MLSDLSLKTGFDKRESTDERICLTLSTIKEVGGREGDEYEVC